LAVGKLLSGHADARAVARDVAFGTAGVTCPALGLGAITADVADARTVIALRALNAVTRQVTYTTASIAGFARGCTAAEGTVAASTAASSIRAGASNVADLAAAVALGTACAASAASAEASTASSTGVFRAITGNVALLAALVARLGLGFHRAVAGDMALQTAVVASRSACLGAIRRLVAEAATVEASTSTRHFFRGSK